MNDDDDDGGEDEQAKCGDDSTQASESYDSDQNFSDQYDSEYERQLEEEKWAERDERERRRQEEKSKERMRRLFSHYQRQLLPFWYTQKIRLDRLMERYASSLPVYDAPSAAATCTIWMGEMEDSGGMKEDLASFLSFVAKPVALASILASSSDAMRTPVAAAAEELRWLGARLLIQGGRTQADEVRLSDMTDREQEIDVAVSMQEEIDTFTIAKADNKVERWEALSTGGFRFVANELPHDDEWSGFLQEFDVTNLVPTALRSLGSVWHESQIVGPPLGADVLAGPLPLHWQTDGVDPATEAIPTCYIQ